MTTASWPTGGRLAAVFPNQPLKTRKYVLTLSLIVDFLIVFSRRIQILLLELRFCPLPPPFSRLESALFRTNLLNLIVD